MRGVILILFGLFIAVTCQRQINLLANPSFEQIDSCPDNVSQINRATGWIFNCFSPDYFNACSTTTEVSVPFNQFGKQAAPTDVAFGGF